MPISGPYSAEKTGVIIIAAPKPAKPRTMPATAATAAAIRKEKASRSGIGRRTLALRAGGPDII